MKAKNKLVFLSLLAFLGVSCEKEYYSTKDNSTPIDLSVPISYNSIIKPILTTNCLGSGCHGVGEQVPVLTADRSYDQLTQLGYVDADTPDTIFGNSLLYKRLIGTAKPMPPIGSLSKSKIEAIALWIKQGSKNN